MSRDVFGFELPQLACPDCPECGQPPGLVVSAVQAFCANDDCAALCWDPSKTAAANRAGAKQVRVNWLTGRTEDPTD